MGVSGHRHVPAVPYLNVLSQKLTGGAEENYENPQSEQTASFHARFKLQISQTQDIHYISALYISKLTSHNETTCGVRLHLMEGVDSGDHYTASYLFVRAKGYIKMFF
jgi:hypothetical protein